MMLKLFSLLCIFMINSVIGDEKICVSQLSTNITDRTHASVVVSFINNAKSLLDEAVKFSTVRENCSSNDHVCEKPRDCTKILADDRVCEQPMDCGEILAANKSAKSGIHRIWLRNRVSVGPRDVYCDMEDESGAWMVIQRRGDFDSGRDYFYKDWNAYKSGFGNPEKDFWLGNDNIFAVTNQRNNVLKFTLTDWDGNKTYATYDEFWIDDETRKYTMHVNEYKGTAGDSFLDTNGLEFSLKDRDNDKYGSNCAQEFKGAWWYHSCHASNLNGMYLKGAHESHADGVEWQTFRGYYYSLKDTVMKIRPKSFKQNPEVVSPQ